MIFESRTYDVILAEALENAPAGVDTRQGSIFYDAVSAACLKLAEFYTDLGYALELVFVATASGEYLDRRAAEYGVTRAEPVPAVYAYEYLGSVPAPGTRFYYDEKRGGRYFEIVKIDGVTRLVAEEAGQAANNVPKGARAEPVNAAPGLERSVFGALVVPGSDSESDDSLRRRIKEKLSGPAQCGNKQHYKTWCEEVPGVGRARVLPLWNGDMTVLAVLVGADGKPAAQTVVAQVQQHVDPEGQGLGNGTANIGAKFLARPAEAVPINVAFKVGLAPGATTESVRAEAVKAIAAYFKELALQTPDPDTLAVKYAAVGAIILALDGVADYQNFTLNAKTANIQLLDTQIPELAGVNVS